MAVFECDFDKLIDSVVGIAPSTTPCSMRASTSEMNDIDAMLQRVGSGNPHVRIGASAFSSSASSLSSNQSLGQKSGSASSLPAYSSPRTGSSLFNSSSSSRSDQRSPTAGDAAVRHASSVAAPEASACRRQGVVQRSRSTVASSRRPSAIRRVDGAIVAPAGALMPRIPAGPRSERAATKPMYVGRCVHLPGASPFA